MEDSNVVNTNDDKINSGSLANLYRDNRTTRYTTNGHDLISVPSSSPDESYDCRRPNIDSTHEDKFRKRINPLRIHLGKRPFVDNSYQHLNTSKKRKHFSTKTNDSNTHSNVPRIPKLIPKRVDLSQFRNVSSPAESIIDNERDKPVPRLVPKSQLLHYKKSKVEKGSQLKEYPQSSALQPMVKFKCRKCCSMSFKTLAMLKEHQVVCRAQAKEPTMSPEATTCTESNSGGPSRVTRKVYLCSACGTYYENWNLFLHMREVHNRHICLFCLGMFSKAEKLSAHLANKHNVNEFSYNNKEEFLNVFNGTLYLMCCVCEEICSEKDDFFNHDCNNVKPKPVPVLVSKNSVKLNNVKTNKNSNEYITNGPTTIAKELPRHNNDTKEIIKTKFNLTSHLYKAAISTATTELANSNTGMSSEISATIVKDKSDTVNCGMESESYDNRPTTSPLRNNAMSPDMSKCLPNGDDHLDHSEESNPSTPDNNHHVDEESKIKVEEEPFPPPIVKEKECGIKLTLSLNSAKSPVIINSTVDPTIGQQNVNKPPPRVRRPPKRYQKAIATNSTPLLALQTKTPSIKMTICDRADSPFVKTTIYENNTETISKTIINNNLESVSTPLEPKQDNNVKTTIYDNKLEEVNTLNRVPKLTVKVPKELLDKDSSSDYSSDSDISDKLTMEEDSIVENETVNEEDLKQNAETVERKLSFDEIKEEPIPTSLEIKENEGDLDPKIEPKIEPPEEETPIEPVIEEPLIPVTQLSLDRPLDKYSLKDLLKVFLTSTVYSCIYCNHVRKIAVNCEQLSLHMVAEHRFAATVDSITAEELLPETITAKLKSGAQELSSVYINLDSYDSIDKCETVQYDHLFECFQCYFKTAIHKDLYLHNRKMHQKTILLCVMCKSNFYSYSELLCHLCPGTYDSEYEVKFRCCLCNVDTIASSFRLMVHIRKVHHTCDVCLEFCQNQARLSNHVWKHKLHHFCYRCGISYRNKKDIANHLFWKHGTESVLCKKCLQKKWPHVYHFCNPPAIFACDDCNLLFTKAVYLKVHKRFHSEEFPHICTEEGCTEKFVSKKLLNKHFLEHRSTQLITDLTEDKPNSSDDTLQKSEEPIPVIDLVDDKPKEEAGSSEVKTEIEDENSSKKSKKKKLKDKDALLLDVNLPALNLSESDSSDESDSGIIPVKEEVSRGKSKVEITDADGPCDTKTLLDKQTSVIKTEEKIDPVEEESSEQQVLDIWDNFKKYQAKVEQKKEKTPPLVTIRKHVCESDHDYCLIPTDMNGEDDMLGTGKKSKKKSLKRRRGDASSSSSSSSDSDSSCSCGSNCSCSSSSGSSSSSSDSDSSDESGNEKKKIKRLKKILPNRRVSTGSNVDVMGNAETPILIPEKVEPPVAETDLETDESDTDEEFYDEHPQRTVDKLFEEKRNQLLSLSVAPSDGGSVSGDASRPSTPVPEEVPLENIQDSKIIKDDIIHDVINDKVDKEEIKTKSTNGKRKNKKKKKSKNSRKHGPIKINIPKEIIAKSEIASIPPLPSTKITISLQTNTVQIPEAPKSAPVTFNTDTPATSAENKRASKRRRVPNKFYGYSSDEEQPQSTMTALKPQQPPKLEWRKEDLPSPVTNKVKKEVPSTVAPRRMHSSMDSVRLTTPIPDVELPRILMNTESMESSDSDSSDEGNLEIYQPNTPASIPIPPPTYLNSGTSSLPYTFQRRVVREAREGESVYCYCRCPYDEVSEMIACDAEGCPIEWFHFECVGIMVPPKGKWYCPECRKNQNFPGYR